MELARQEGNSENNQLQLSIDLPPSSSHFELHIDIHSHPYFEVTFHLFRSCLIVCADINHIHPLS